MKISRLSLPKFDDYEAASRLLQSDLGCWNFQESRGETLTIEAKSALKIYLLNGRGVLDGRYQVEAGNLIEAPAGTTLSLRVTAPIKLRSCWTENLVLRERLETLFRSVNKKNEAPGVPSLQNGSVYFCTEPGALFARLFSQAARVPVLNLRDVLCFTFHGIEPDSELMKTARTIAEISEDVPDLRKEELLEKRGGRWYRVGVACENKVATPERGDDDDALVELILSNLWSEPNSLCRWMNSAPHFQASYAVPYLHLPGRKVSQAFRERWKVEGVCSAIEQTLPIRDIIVKIDDRHVTWTCDAARELAKWSYRVSGSEVKFELLEVYD